MKVLVTCPPMLKNIDLFRDQFTKKGIELITPEVTQTLSVEELLELVPNVEGWIIGDDPAKREVFEAGKKGKLIAAVKWGVGVDNVDFEACKDLGIPISNTPRMFGGEVADLAMAYLLGLARNSYQIDREVRKGNWIKPSGSSIAGKTVAVVGLGDIGQATIRRLKGFDVTIIGYDPFLKEDLTKIGVDIFDSFPNQIEKADFIIITCALTPSSKYLINQDTISKMKTGVRIINVSRGPLINEEHLLAALKSEKIESVALDVFEVEPLLKNHPILDYPKCILGAHNGSNTTEGVIRASHKAIELLFGFLNLS